MHRIHGRSSKTPHATTLTAVSHFNRTPSPIKRQPKSRHGRAFPSKEPLRLIAHNHPASYSKKKHCNLHLTWRLGGGALAFPPNFADPTWFNPANNKRANDAPRAVNDGMKRRRRAWTKVCKRARHIKQKTIKTEDHPFPEGVTVPPVDCTHDYIII